MKFRVLPAVLLLVFGLCSHLSAATATDVSDYTVNSLSITGALSAWQTDATDRGPIYLSKHDQVAIECAAVSLTNLGTNVVTFTFARSIDGVAPGEASFFALDCTANGLVSGNVITNIDMGAFGYLWLTSVACSSNLTDGEGLTNVVTPTVRYAVKPDRKGTADE